MKTWMRIIFTLLLITTPAMAQTLERPAIPLDESGELAELYAEAVRAAAARVSPALVQVRAIGDYRTVERDATGAITGVLLDRRWVVTSLFGLQRRPEVLIVTLANGETRSASLVSIDHSRQTALLRLSEEAPDDPPSLEPRSDPRPGETAIGVGAAYAAESPNISVGVVSAANRRLGRAVQTDAAVSPANYGGLLIDLRGRVLGLLIPAGEPNDPSGGADWYDSGIGFATPLEAITARLAKMQSGDDIHPGRAGLALTTGHEFLESPSVRTVLPGGPADAAGLRKGDLVASVNGAAVATQKQFRIALGPLDAGEVVELGVLRGEEELALRVTLAATSELPKPVKKQVELLEGPKEDLPEPE